MPKIQYQETDYAWAAGIVDGEGCLFIGRHKATKANGCRADNYFLALKVTMGHEQTILRLRRMFGSGSKHRVEQVGWNHAYTWLIQAKLFEVALGRIEPYLVTKKAEAKVAREFLNLPGWGGGNKRGPKTKAYQRREYRLWDKMRRLKPRTRFKLDHRLIKDDGFIYKVMGVPT